MSMKASEALLLGSLVTTQGFGAESPASSTPCALGTIAQVLGLQFTNFGVYSTLGQIYPWMLQEGYDCPMCPDSIGSYKAMSLIYHLNDQHKLSRNKIAEWIATVEPKELTYQEPVFVKENTVSV